MFSEERSIFVRLFNQGTRVEINHDIDNEAAKKPEEHVHLDWMSRWFQEWYAPVLMHPAMRALVLLWFCLYIGFSGYLCTQVRQGLEPVKLLVEGSYAIPHYVSLEEYFWRNGSEMQLVINNAPNLANRTERQRVKEMVSAFANTSHSLGPAGVQFWLYDFERYLEDEAANTNHRQGTTNIDEFYEIVQQFMLTPTYERLSEDVFWGNVTLPNNQTHWMIKSFRVSIGLTRFETAILQIETVNLMRQVAAAQRYSDMNITTFNPVWLFVDQYQEILPNVLQEVISGMSFMVTIALLLIPHPLTSFWVAVTILSVDVGVIGFMTIWGINLDTISMITIIMSIGFSVDFAAHIAHAFVLSSDKDAGPKEKVKAAMGEIAWPILQGATSTILGVVVLADLDSYMVVAFFKTVFLVIVLALIHGLVFLPVLLGIFVTRRCGAGETKKQNDSRANLNINVDMSTAFSRVQAAQQRQDSGPATVRSRHSSKVHPASTVVSGISYDQSTFSEPALRNSQLSRSDSEPNGNGIPVFNINTSWANGGSNPAFEMEDGFGLHNQSCVDQYLHGNFADSRM